MSEPKPRWGIRFTNNPSKNKQHVQNLSVNDPESVKRGELFLNEFLDEVYYINEGGLVTSLFEGRVVPFTQISFMGIRVFETDQGAAAADPPVPVGGLYRTAAGVLKIRVE